MKFSTRARYGIKVLLDLALHWGEGPVLLKDIAERQQIPLSYLEQLIGPLVQRDMIKTARGTRGGVSLLRSPKEIILGEAILILEGSLAPVTCVDNPESCRLSEICVTHDVWDEVKQAISKVLGSITLQDLVERRRKKLWERRSRKQLGQ